MNVLYPAIFEYDRAEKRYMVHFPEDMEIPKPSRHKGAKLIAPSARAQAALLMRWAKGEHTTAEIARALNTSWPAVARLEDPHHWPNLRQLERAAAAIGQRLVISLEPLSNETK